MDPWIIVLIVAVAGVLVSLPTVPRSKKPRQQHNHRENSNNEEEELSESQMDRAAFVLTLGAIGRSITDEVATIRDTMLDDVTAYKERVEAELAASKSESLDAIKALGEQAILEEKERLETLDATIKRNTEVANAEYSRMADHFRESVEDQPAQAVLAAAYSLVASNQPPRDKLDLNLAVAVVAHRKTGGPTGVPEKKDVKPENLN